MVHIFAYVLFIIYIIPIIFIVLFSFTDVVSIATGTLSFSSFTIQNYVTILSDTQILRPLFNSIRFSSVAAVLGVFFIFFIVLIQFKKKNKITGLMQYIILIPWLLPSTVIALGLITSYNQATFLFLGRSLIGTSTIVIISYIIIKMPFTYRLLRAIYYTVDDSYESASKSLGAGPLYTFRRVTLPMVLPTVIALMVINFNSMLDDYNLTVFLYHPLQRTLGIDIKNKTDLMAGGDVQVVLLIYTVLLMTFSAITLYIAYGKLLKKVD